MRHIVGWSPPPRPIQLAPSFLTTDSPDEQKRKILLDWYHDDDLRSWIGNDDVVFQMGGGGTANAILMQSLLQFYFNPTSFAPGAGTYWAGTPCAPGQCEHVWSQADVQKRWNELDQLLTNVVIPKRQGVGSLPANDYSDPVVIYYYDNDHMKRVSYPVSSMHQASDMSQDSWWSISGVGTQQLNGDGTWGDEGFDYDKDVAGKWLDIGKILLSAISIVLAFTGIGALASSVIIAFGEAIVTILGAADQAIRGGNPAGALMQFGTAIATVAAKDLSAVSKTASTLGSYAIKAFGATLKSLAITTDPVSNPDLPSSLEAIKAQASAYGPMDETRLYMLGEFLAATYGPLQAEGMWNVIREGYEMAQWADSDDLAGMISDYGQISAPAQTLFQMGVTMGTLARGQQGGAVVLSPYAVLPSSMRTSIQMVPRTPMDELMNYIRTTLQPRYHL